MPREIEVKSVLNKSKKRDSWFLSDYSFNPYSSCAFNCLYCYIRGSKYGENLETSLSVKINSIEILEKQLASRAKRGQYGYIVLSSATDPYLKLEKEYQLTRQALELIHAYRFPVHMITKSDLILRDLDLLAKIDRDAQIPEGLDAHIQNGCIISFSFSFLNDAYGKIFEPGATPTSLRLKALEKVLAQGFLAGVSLMPLLPWISDTTEHLELLFSTFKATKVRYVLPATLTLYGNTKADSKTLMLRAIRKHFPELEKKYLKYFAEGHEMPVYYRNAFYQKMKDICQTYQLNDAILKAARFS